MRAFSVLWLLCAAAVAGPAFAQTPATAPDMTRFAGVVKTWDGHTLVVTAADGEHEISVAADARISERRPGSLADVKPGSFIGAAAVTGPDGRLRATEVHIFAESERGTGEGHRNMAAPSTTMTNGSVKSMTNGNVSATGSTAAGTMLTVTYAGGQQDIYVGPEVAVNVSTPAERSQLKIGVQVRGTGRKAADGRISAQAIEIAARP